MLNLDKVYLFSTAFRSSQFEIESAILTRPCELRLEANSFKGFPQNFLKLPPFKLYEGLRPTSDQFYELPHCRSHDPFVCRICLFRIVLFRLGLF